MRSTTYTPANGSIAARVIEFLRIEGGTLTPHKIADLFNTRRAGITTAMIGTVAAGLLVHHRGGRFKTGYHLPGTEPSFDGDATDDQGVEDKPGKPDKPAKATAPASQRATRAPKAAAPEPEAQQEAPAAIASLWDDGDVVLAGISINDDAESVTLNDAQARQVHRFLERIYGPNAGAAGAA